MADTPTSPAIAGHSSEKTEPDSSVPHSNPPDPSPPSSSSAPSTSLPVNPNPTAPPPIAPQSVQPYGQPQAPAVPPVMPPSFRPLAPPLPMPAAPQFSPVPSPNLQNSNYQNPNVQPPGVPGAAGGAGAAALPAPPVMMPYPPPGQPLRPYMQMPNGYPTMTGHAPQGMIPPPGIPRYPSPYPILVRPTFPPRPPGAMGVIPALPRPPILGIRGPIIPPVIRPAVVPSVTPAEKPQTTVYVGKIASTVENDFMLSLLQLCGPVKNWKRAQDPSNGTPKGFGFCEFDAAEGVLRALRLLSKLNVDGQELVLNVNQATREFLERVVQKRKEDLQKDKTTETEGAEKEGESLPHDEKSETLKPSVDETNKDVNDSENKDTDITKFGMVTDEDKEADREALEKLTSMLEERLKTKPPPPTPPPATTDASGNSNSELPATSKDRDSEVDILRNEDKNDEEMTSESKLTSEHDRPETSSPDKSRRNDRRSRDRDRDRDRDLKREKERELERYEREREQERAIRERERELKNRDDERRYRLFVKRWESEEREKERSRKLEKEREKEKEYKRRREIMEMEHEIDEGDTKKRKHKSSGSDERWRRRREKEEDLADRLKEEEEIAEAKKRADEERREQGKQKQNALEFASSHFNDGSDEAVMADETNGDIKDKVVERTSDGDSGHENHIGDGMPQNGTDDSAMGTYAMSDTRHSSAAPAKKLGFGLVGSGKRTAVPSVFHEEEDEDAQKDKKMRPLVPIDYSTEELQAVQPASSVAPSSNLMAAAEFAKRISNNTSKEERPEGEKERSRRSHDRSSQRDRERNNGETSRSTDENRKEAFERDKDREHGLDKGKALDNQKLLDAKQLIDMIPKTKEELFSYEINWAVYDKNELHEKMRPWISKKITEFLGEEETSLVDFIVSTTREHVKASEMLERMQLILDDEAEMFVLKLWRMLIFEIKRIETGLAMRSKS